MKKLRLLVILALFASVFVLPLTVTTKAGAEAYKLKCMNSDGEFSNTTTEGCDMAITKRVSVNGGAFFDADTSSSAVQAHIGDKVTWRIVVTNKSESGLTPFGIVKVSDTLPVGVTAVSSSATVGSYTSNTWTFNIGSSSTDPTLTITSTANATGLIKNSATFTDYDPNNCDGPCEDPPYVDANSANNTNDAYVNVVSVATPKPAAVVVTPSAPDTGFGVFTTNPIRTLVAYLGGAFVLLMLAITARRFSKKAQ